MAPTMAVSENPISELKLGCTMPSGGADGSEELPWASSSVLVVYSGMLVVYCGMLVTQLRTLRRRSQIHLLMLHLALADLAIAAVVIPLEIGWKYTNAWLAGNVLCKVILVLRSFVLYLSSNILVCISIDRLFAVMYPTVAWERSKLMLVLAWSLALVCSLPQGLIFIVSSHPLYIKVDQCTPAHRTEVLYRLFCLCAVYFIPFIAITACYVGIFLLINLANRVQYMNEHPMQMFLPRSGNEWLQRARLRTLCMTLIIVFTFALCWLPYAIMTLWYIFDVNSAEAVLARSQDLLFAMALSNACVNPLVYGTCILNIHRTLAKLMRSLCCQRASTSETYGTSTSATLEPLVDEANLLMTGCVIPASVHFGENAFIVVPDTATRRPTRAVAKANIKHPSAVARASRRYALRQGLRCVCASHTGYRAHWPLPAIHENPACSY